MGVYLVSGFLEGRVVVVVGVKVMRMFVMKLVVVVVVVMVCCC